MKDICLKCPFKPSDYIFLLNSTKKIIIMYLYCVNCKNKLAMVTSLIYLNVENNIYCTTRVKCTKAFGDFVKKEGEQLKENKEDKEKDRIMKGFYERIGNKKKITIKSLIN